MYITLFSLMPFLTFFCLEAVLSGATILHLLLPTTPGDLRWAVLGLFVYVLTLFLLSKGLSKLYGMLSLRTVTLVSNVWDWVEDYFVMAFLVLPTASLALVCYPFLMRLWPISLPASESVVVPHWVVMLSVVLLAVFLASGYAFVCIGQADIVLTDVKEAPEVSGSR